MSHQDSNHRIYLDYQATTPMDPRVLDAMSPFFCEVFGNAASVDHLFGWEAGKAVQTARQEVAQLINAQPDEIVFTSGATESDNIALKGVVEACGVANPHIVTVVTEHKSILDTCDWLESKGCETTLLPVDSHGIVDLETLSSSLRANTVVVSVMHANNEIGVLQPIEEIAAICRERGIVFHSDGAQSVGRIQVDAEALGVDLMSLSAHKMYGPKGVGALYVRNGMAFRPKPLVHGGGHESGLRSGTLNVPGIVGFGKAASIAREELAGESQRIAGLRDQLWEHLTTKLEAIHLNGHPEQRLPGALNVSFDFVEGEALILSLKNVAVSTGSACTSAQHKPSHVLESIGVPEIRTPSTLRISLGRFTTQDEVEEVGRRLVEQVNRLREFSPLWEMHRRGINVEETRWNDAHHSHHED